MLEFCICVMCVVLRNVNFLENTLIINEYEIIYYFSSLPSFLLSLSLHSSFYCTFLLFLPFFFFYSPSRRFNF